MPAENDAKITVVAGAAMGIGAAIGEQLARDGMTVLVSDVNLQQAEKTAQRLRDAGMSAAVTDVGAADSISTAFARIETDYRRCDVLVNNAGIAKTFLFIDFDPAPLRAALESSGFYKQAQQQSGPEAWGLLTKYTGPVG